MAPIADRLSSGARSGRASELWAAAVVRARWVIIVAWVAAAVAATALLPSIRDAQVGAVGDLVPTDAAAIEAEQRAYELFRFPLLSRTIVVQRAPDGLSVEEQAAAVRRAVALNRNEIGPVDGIAGALPLTNGVGSEPFARETSTTSLTYLFFPPDIGQLGRTGLARLFARIAVPEPPGTFVGVTGAVPARAEQSQIVADTLPRVEVATLALVTIALALFFRAAGPPLVTLATVAVAYAVAVRVVAQVGREIGVSVPSEVQPVIVVLLFGVGTDYTIFFLSRLRRRLLEGAERHDAVRTTTAELVPIVSAAGMAVVLGSASLAVAELGFLRAFGPGLAMAMLVALAVTLTLVPALLAVAGGWVFWPTMSTPTGTGAHETASAAANLEHAPVATRGVLAFAVRRPVLTTVACSAALLAASSGLLHLESGNPLIRGLPADAEARQAYEHASRGFTPGVLSPTMLLVEAPDITERRTALARLQALLDRERGTAAVAGPADQPLRPALGAALSPTGDAARYLVILDADPLGHRAIALLHSIEQRLPRLLAEAGLAGARTSVAGDTALSAETVERTGGDTARVVPVVLAVLFVVLAVFLRALVAPLYLLAASALAVGAALGLGVYVLQDLLHGEISYFVPFAAAVLLASLGSDYTIFLAGRVWGEAGRRPLREAILVGGSRAARSIALAGGVLAGSFALLAIVPLRPFRELAFVMGVGLLIDAFLVRTLLVPALMQLVGTRGAWPSRLRRQ